MPELVERLMRIETQLESHTDSDGQNFERLALLINNMKREILDQLKPIGFKVDALWDEKNQREGALSLSKVLAGCLGGTIGSGLTVIFEVWMKK